jgi:hypothetical protein
VKLMTADGATRAYLLFGGALAVFVVLLLLDLVLRREWVKQNLPQLCARYVSIRWAPLGPGWGVYWHPAFRVVYLDAEGRMHKAYCGPRNITWHSPLVWVKDELAENWRS